MWEVAIVRSKAELEGNTVWMWADQSAFVSMIPKHFKTPRLRQTSRLFSTKVALMVGPSVKDNTLTLTYEKIHPSTFNKAHINCAFYPLSQSHHERTWQWNPPGRCCEPLMHYIKLNSVPLWRAIFKNKGVKDSPESYLLAKSLAAVYHPPPVIHVVWYNTGSLHNECMKVGVMGACIVHKTMGQLGPHDTLGWRDEGLLGLSPPPLFLYH